MKSCSYNNFENNNLKRKFVHNYPPLLYYDL